MRKFGGSSIAVYLVLSALLGCWLPTTVCADVPALLNYQGRLLNGTNLFNGIADLTFSIYPTATGGLAAYVDTNQVTVVDGLYAAFIGAGPVSGSLTGALASGTAYLEVDINGTTLTPRERLVSSAYALIAPGGGDFVSRTGDTMSGGLIINSNLEVRAGLVSSPSSFVTGAGVNITVSSGEDESTTNAVALRASVSQPGNAFGTHNIRGISGNITSGGGFGTSLTGGYFNSKVLGTTSAGVQSAIGVSADAEVQSGATGFNLLNFLAGGRFGCDAEFAGLAQAYGVFAHADRPHQGWNTGVLGMGAGSGRLNIGVAGLANATQNDVFTFMIQMNLGVGSNGVGVVGFNLNTNGYAIMARGRADVSSDLSVGGNVTASTITGRGAVPWSVIAATNLTATSNRGYLATNDAIQMVITLPAAPTVGDVVRVAGAGTAGWRLAQQAGQTVRAINIGLANTTPGPTGGLTGNANAAIELLYVGGNVFLPVSSAGTMVAF